MHSSVDDLRKNAQPVVSTGKSAVLVIHLSVMIHMNVSEEKGVKWEERHSRPLGSFCSSVTQSDQVEFCFCFLTIYSDKLTELGLTYFKGFVVILVF